MSLVADSTPSASELIQFIDRATFCRDDLLSCMLLAGTCNKSQLEDSLMESIGAFNPNDYRDSELKGDKLLVDEKIGLVVASTFALDEMRRRTLVLNLQRKLYLSGASDDVSIANAFMLLEMKMVASNNPRSMNELANKSSGISKDDELVELLTATRSYDADGINREARILATWSRAKGNVPEYTIARLLGDAPFPYGDGTFTVNKITEGKNYDMDRYVYALMAIGTPLAYEILLSFYNKLLGLDTPEPNKTVLVRHFLRTVGYADIKNSRWKLVEHEVADEDREQYLIAFTEAAPSITRMRVALREGDIQTARTIAQYLTDRSVFGIVTIDETTQTVQTTSSNRVTRLLFWDVTQYAQFDEYTVKKVSLRGHVGNLSPLVVTQLDVNGLHPLSSRFSSDYCPVVIGLDPISGCLMVLVQNTSRDVSDQIAKTFLDFLCLNKYDEVNWERQDFHSPSVGLYFIHLRRRFWADFS